MQLIKANQTGTEFKVLIDLNTIPYGMDLVRKDGIVNCHFNFPTGNAILEFEVQECSKKYCVGETTDKEYSFSLGSPYNGNYNTADCEVYIGDVQQTSILLKNADDTNDL
jgi:hypothetical protein